MDTENNRPARRALLGNNLRNGIVAHVCSGCLPSVRETNLMGASCQAILAQWIYIPSSQKTGNLPRFINRVRKYVITIKKINRKSLRLKFFLKKTRMSLKSNILF